MRRVRCALVPTSQLDRDTLELVAVAAAVGAALALLLVLFALGRIRALSAKVRRLSAAPRLAPGEPDPDVLRHVAVVRYDAFADMGGRLSFSAALYDDNGNGLVISSINGRSETRTYAKPLTGFRSDHSLSPEEQRAIEDARRV